MSHSILRNSVSGVDTNLAPKWADGYVLRDGYTSMPIRLSNINDLSIQVKYTTADGYLTLQVSNHIERETGTVKADQSEGWLNWEWNTAPITSPTINTGTSASPQLIRYPDCTERWARLIRTGAAPLTVQYSAYQGKSNVTGD